MCVVCQEEPTYIDTILIKTWNLHNKYIPL